MNIFFQLHFVHSVSFDVYRGSAIWSLWPFYVSIRHYWTIFLYISCNYNCNWSLLMYTSVNDRDWNDRECVCVCMLVCDRERGSWFSCETYRIYVLRTNNNDHWSNYGPLVYFSTHPSTTSLPPPFQMAFHYFVVISWLLLLLYTCVCVILTK